MRSTVTFAFVPHRPKSLVATVALCLLLLLGQAAPAGAAQGDGASSDAMPTTRSASSDLSPGDPATLTFRGGGWGHGLGMSQYGAYGRAAAGKKHPAILRFYYREIRLTQSRYTGKVAVQVGTVSTATFRPRGHVDLRLNNKVKGSAEAGQEVTVRRSGAGWSLKVDGVERCGPGACAGGSFALTYGDGTVVEVGGVGAYDHGKIRLVPTSAGSSSLYVVVASLTMDEYLYGLAEMPSSWPAEALKAQAVAGRSFAQRTIEDRRASPSWNLPFDVYASTRDQVYAGRAKSAGYDGDRWVDAVDGTSHKIATYDGRPITAFYSSSHGGYSANSEYVFTEMLPYIRANPDPFDSYKNPFHEWTRTYSIAELSQWLGRYGVGTIRSIEVLGGAGESGRLNKATVALTGSSGTRHITGNELRWAINEGAGSSLDRQLLSTKFRLGGGAASDRPPVGNWKFREKVDSGPNARVTLRGWALDPDTSRSIRVFLTDNGEWAGGTVANDPRPGIAGEYGLGPNHGFELFRALSPGRHELCLNARNDPDDAAVELRCRTVRVGTSPAGRIGSVRSGVADTLPFTPATVTVAGRASDSDTDAGIDVVIAANGVTVTTTTVDGRFSAGLLSPPGPSQICATAKDDSGLRPDRDLGCVDHDVVDRDPIGKFTLSLPGEQQVRAHGWALDPDTAAPVRVQLQVNGVTVTSRVADDARPAIASKYGLGPAHGFDLDTTVDPGRHQFCVLARDATAANAPLVSLACRTITVA